MKPFALPVALAICSIMAAGCVTRLISQEELDKASKFVYLGKEVTVTTDFDNGALAKVEERETNGFDIRPFDHFDYHHGSFGFLFRLDGCKNKKVTLRFHVRQREKEEDAVSSLYANPDFPVYSYDGDVWDRMANKSLADSPTGDNWKIVSVEERFTEDRVYVAFQYPYSNEHLSNYIKTITNSPFCTIETAGHSTEGRDIRQIVITDPAVPLKSKKTVCVTGIQHAAEPAAGWGLEGMIDFLLSDDPTSKEARAKYLFKIIPIVSVDAVAEGKGRFSSGKNPNREWEKATHLVDIGSIVATRAEWLKNDRSIDMLIDFHGFSSRDGSWQLMVWPEGSYKDGQEKAYRRLLSIIKERFPRSSIDTSSNPYEGCQIGAGLRQYGALSMIIDAYVYRWPKDDRTPDLDSFYKDGSKIWPLEDIKAGGVEFVRALVELSQPVAWNGRCEAPRVYWQLPTGEVSCRLMNEDGTMKRPFNIRNAAQTLQVRAAGDIDCDGVSDLILQQPDGRTLCWLMNSNGTIKRSFHILNTAQTWQVCAAGDIDRDGVSDLILQQSDGRTLCWLMNSNGTTKKSFFILNSAQICQVRAACDIDGDGVADIIWQLPAGEVYCWLMNSDGTMKRSFFILNAAQTLQVRAAGDIDRDGVSDLILQQPDGRTLCWLMNSNGTMKRSFSMLDGAQTWQVCGAE